MSGTYSASIGIRHARMIKRIQPDAVPESDAPFSQIVLDDCYAYLAGLVAADFPHGLAAVSYTHLTLPTKA